MDKLIQVKVLLDHYKPRLAESFLHSISWYTAGMHINFLVTDLSPELIYPDDSWLITPSDILAGLQYKRMKVIADEQSLANFFPDFIAKMDQVRKRSEGRSLASGVIEWGAV